MKEMDYKEIVSSFYKPTLVLAGPGAGKTHLLCDHVKKLLDKNIDNKNITVVTFGVDAM